MGVLASSNNIQIISDDLSIDEAEAYCEYAFHERTKVDTYWGPTWKESVRIHIDSSYLNSKALLPAYRGNRGFMEMPLLCVRHNNGPLLHEMTHIYAPNDNRFLAEGLAVYLQFKMGGNQVKLIGDRNLHELAGEKALQVNSLQIYNRVRTPAPLGKNLQDIEGRRTGYIIGGSFVGYLIEKYGLLQFKEVYKNDDYCKIEGKSLEILESEWREFLKDSFL